MGQSASVLRGSKGVDPVEELADQLADRSNLFNNDMGARKMFSRYLLDGKWVEKLRNCELTGSVRNPEPQKNTMMDSYVIPENQRDYVKSRLGEDHDVSPVSNSAHTRSIISICFRSEQMKAVFLATVIPIFLESEEYAAHMDTAIPRIHKQSSNSGETKQGTGIRVETRRASQVGREERLEELFRSTQLAENGLMDTAEASVDVAEMNAALSNSDWLADLLVVVEDLPLCVSLATARSNRRGFPLIYVNKKFSSVTGYQREEIVGHNCKFLQSDRSEPEQVAKLIDALANARPCKVALSNKRKDGSEFFNLLALKPIFNSTGEYSYVIGVQYDISDESSSEREIKMVDDLLSILPNLFK